MVCSISTCVLSDADYTDAGPYSLVHFLPVGTLHRPLASLDFSASITSCDEHWHRYSPQCAPLMHAEDDQIIQSLDFLVMRKFVDATCRVSAGPLPSTAHQLLIRIYLIPNDLAGVGGVLRAWKRSEDLVLTPARKCMRILLPQVSRDVSSWQGHISDVPVLLSQPFFEPHAGPHTLAEIYTSLPSPIIKDTDPRSLLGQLTHQIMTKPIPGMQSALHSYQRRSVVAMVQRELANEDVPNPVYIPIRGMDGRNFYFQPATMEILQDRPIISPTWNGILCEELGTGKTVMALALILSTIDQLPGPEADRYASRPVLTPLALRHFPQEPYAAARRDFAAGSSRRAGDIRPSSMPSLVELMLHHARTHPDILRIRHSSDQFPVAHLWKPYICNAPFYHQYDVTGDVLFEDGQRRSRHKRDNGPKTMYLSSTTLVIVPPNLLNQWLSEINKHCDETLVVFTATERTKLPPAVQLASSYDVILMTHPRLAHEVTRMKDQQSLYSWRNCSCAELPGTSVRVPDCRCQPPVDVSPLLQIRWKRLIIDEGHVLAATTTNLMTFIGKMSIERKWIVTGTPTTNMMGLHFGEGSEVQESQIEGPVSHALGQKLLQGDLVEESSDEPNVDLGLLDEIDLEYPEDDDDNAADPDAPPGTVNTWKKYRSDLTKLSRMISSFLGVLPFAADSKLFSSQVIAPLMDPAGPLHGSVQVLEQVMAAVMIRHRTEDIEKEITLPPLQHDTVLLDLDPYAAMTYNLMQASILINAVDSDRRDQDYLFHPSKAAELQLTIENMSQAMFWHVDDEVFNVDEIMQESENFLETSRQKFVSGRIPQSDFDMLGAAIQHTRAAAADPVWRALHAHPNVFQRIYNLPAPVYDAWSQLPSEIRQVTDASSPSPFYLVTPEKLKTLRNFLLKKPLASVPRIIEVGETVAEEEQRRYEYNLSCARGRKALRIMTSKRRGNAKAGSGKMDLKAAIAARTDSVTKMLEAQQKLKDLIAKSDDQGHDSHPQNNLHMLSPLAGVTVGNSTSSKLDYILSEIRLYSPKEKFLIFSRSPLTLMYIAEGLGVTGIQYKLSPMQKIKARVQDVMTFESSETYRVFLMELKHGARGLNIVTASRVIFCEPVWQADVETQAIKRVHRIGQKLPVTVKTLAIRATAEEFMVSRRDDLKRGLGAAGGKLPDLANDTSMRNFIANPRFLPIPPPPPSTTLNFPLLPLGTSSPSLRGSRVNSFDHTSTAARFDLSSRSASPTLDATDSAVTTAEFSNTAARKKGVAVPIPRTILRVNPQLTSGSVPVSSYKTAPRLADEWSVSSQSSRGSAPNTLSAAGAGTPTTCMSALAKRKSSSTLQLSANVRKRLRSDLELSLGAATSGPGIRRSSTGGTASPSGQSTARLSSSTDREDETMKKIVSFATPPRDSLGTQQDDQDPLS